MACSNAYCTSLTQDGLHICSGCGAARKPCTPETCKAHLCRFQGCQEHFTDPYHRLCTSHLVVVKQLHPRLNIVKCIEPGCDNVTSVDLGSFHPKLCYRHTRLGLNFSGSIVPFPRANAVSWTKQRAAFVEMLEAHDCEVGCRADTKTWHRNLGTDVTVLAGGGAGGTAA